MNPAPLVAIDGIVLDTETTGLDARIARLVQIGALRLSTGTIKLDDRFERLVNPGQPIPQAAVAVHGITDVMVSAAQAFPAVAAEFEAFAGRSIIIGHTVEYDLAVLRREYALAGLPVPRFRALDVRVLARMAAPSLADYGLERLCEWLGITIKGRHTAIGDAQAAGEVFLALIPILRGKGIRTLAEAEAASRALAEREASGIGQRGWFPAAGSDAPVLAKLESFPYHHLVRDVMSSPPVFVMSETVMRDALRELLDKRVSSTFVRTTSGEVGIITEHDILHAIGEAGEAALATPVSRIMSAPLQTVPDDALLYRAIGRLQRLGFRHLGVTNVNGEIVGAVTSRNLLRHRATAAVVLGDAVDSATTSAALATAWAQLPIMARSLMKEEVEPSTISAVISSEIQAMTCRAAELAEQRLRREGAGTPPVPYAVLVLGSAGRGESQLAADQDNAIIYAHGIEGGPADRYFETLAIHMNETLDAAGVPLCKGGVMARHRAWRKSAGDWRATIDSWVRRQRPEDLLNVDIFFDAVPVHGAASMAQAAWAYAYDRAHAARDFQNLLIEVARRRDGAFSLFGGFKVDHRGRIDLKHHGLMPIFTAARVLSIRHGVRARSTTERLRGVAAQGVGSPEIIETILEAQRVILGAIIAQQLVDGEDGVPLSARVVPAKLSKMDKRKLKRALSAANEAVGLVSEGRI